ncbi:hypothetical protein B0H14DRAFT_3143873 [Mycena olivaceomarginata]|nr:hypothetical protein B0H14DRAFT_3143873 [Mycena olivaceomarginata]
MPDYHLYEDDDGEDGLKDLLEAATRLIAVFSESDFVSLGYLPPAEILNLADYLCKFLHDLDQPPQRTPTQLAAAPQCLLHPRRRCRCRPRCKCRFPFPCPLLLPRPSAYHTSRKLSLNITSRHRGIQPAAMILGRGGDEGQEEDQGGSEDDRRAVVPLLFSHHFLPDLRPNILISPPPGNHCGASSNVFLCFNSHENRV